MLLEDRDLMKMSHSLDDVKINFNLKFNVDVTSVLTVVAGSVVTVVAGALVYSLVQSLVGKKKEDRGTRVIVFNPSLPAGRVTAEVLLGGIVFRESDRRKVLKLSRCC